ncbi:MAG: hypothetical protein MNPFHGCM_00691 [Gemmatimonadaceae bacterium]|nr:hypothetical protein [Gemmatimonadaceae bacterium]
MSCRWHLGFLLMALGSDAAVVAPLGAQRPDSRRASAATNAVTLQRQARTAQQRRIPNVVGMSVASARAALSFTAHTIVQIDSVAPGVPPNQVLRQRPAAGRPVAITKVDTLWVAIPRRSAMAGAILGQGARPRRLSPGTDTSRPRPTGSTQGERDTPPTLVPQDAIVPDLYGMERRTALRVIRANKLRLAADSMDYSDLQPAGRVFRQSPQSGLRVPPGSDVVVWVSRGPHLALPSVSVPALYGLTIAQARDVLLRIGLDTGRIIAIARRGASGRVEHQEPHEGSSAHPGDRVDLTIAMPPPLVAVPSLSGRTEASAESLLASVGLALRGVRRRAIRGGTGSVIATDPEEGTLVEAGSQVELTIGYPERVISLRVPDVGGRTLAGADSILAAAGLSLGAVDVEPSDTTALVLRQRPAAGDTLPAGAAVAITIGMEPHSPPRLRLPDVRRLSLDSAQRVLRGEGFGRVAISGFLDTSAVVVDQDPAPGAIASADSTVGLVADSLVVRVPNLFGLTESRARDRARRDGLSMPLLPPRRALVLRATVDSQFPPFDAVVRGSSTVAARLVIPIVPPIALLAAGIVLLAGVVILAWPGRPPTTAVPSVSLRLVTGPADAATIDRATDRSIVERALYLTIEVTRDPVVVHTEAPTMIASEEWHNV